MSRTIQPPDRRTAGNTRETIKQIVTRSLIENGYRGSSMSRIAAAGGMTTTNIFYHFKNKEKLIDEVVADYVADALERQRVVWIDPQLSLRQKIAQVVQNNRLRYEECNPPGTSGQSWSLIGRLRMESEMLSDAGQAELRRFGEDLYVQILGAMEQARASGEIAPGSPLGDAALILAHMINSASQIVIDKGSFEALEEYCTALTNVVFNAWGGVNSTP